MTFTGRIIAPLALAATLFGAGSAQAATTVSAGSAKEGETLTVAVNGKCSGAAKCKYTIATADGTATANEDYRPASLKGTAKRGATFARTLSVALLDDDPDESDETFTVTVKIKRGTVTKTSSATETIIQPVEGGTTTGTTTPNPFPADSGEPTEKTIPTASGFVQLCETPYWIGNQGQFGAWGNYNRGCKTTIKCPFGTSGCTILGSGIIDSEKRVGQKVTLNSRLVASDKAGKVTFKQDQSCADTDHCQTSHGVEVQAEATATIDCNGIRATGPVRDRAKITCGAEVVYKH